VLHAYDADDVRRELWNSLEIPARDDCGEYSKMAPPTIANGKVYLASFGAKNNGTGQFCVYGLLPSAGATKPAAPTGGRAEILGGKVVLTWDGVPQARFYRVARTSRHEGDVVTTGLTTASFTEAAPASGETFEYRIFAVNSDGESAASKVVSAGGVSAAAQGM
jgi:hypothetical protein